MPWSRFALHNIKHKQNTIVQEESEIEEEKSKEIDSRNARATLSGKAE
jgi:hypothetical protein